jgi:predicted TIM-barrel fold metal-dependent hydrolase
MGLEKQHKKPKDTLPRGAADCHMHVFGPFARYPLAAERAYNVEEAPLAAHERMKAQVGLERTVLVQASGYGMDNRAMLDALDRLGSRGRAVAVVSLDVSSDELRAMHERGVRGVRLNLLTLGSRHSGDPSDLLHRYGTLVAPLGWHVQVFISAPMLVAMQKAIRGCVAPVVVDHMGLPDAAQGLSQPGFQALLQLMQEKHVWAKLAGADRITRSSGRLRDAVPFMRALVDAAPQRLVWGSDWPNLGFHSGTQVHGDEVLPHRELDAGELLDVLAEAVPDAATRAKVLAENPAMLYDFR